jgi:TPR repeat protein
VEIPPAEEPAPATVQRTTAPAMSSRSGEPGRDGRFTHLDVLRRAEAGDVESQYRLAQMLSTGEGAPQSLDDAARWYLAAAEQGHEMAAYKLGFLNYRGRGVPRKDFVQAYRWFSVAAESGVGDAAVWRDRVREKMTRQEIEEADRLTGKGGTGQR